MTPADQEYLQRCRALLRINKHALDDELEVQAEYQEEIGRRCELLEHRVSTLKDELARTEARLIEEFRDGATKDLAEAKAKRHPDRRQVWDRYQEAVEAHALYSNLLDAWKAKGKDIHALGKLFGDQYFSLTAKSVSHRRREERPVVARRDYSRPESEFPDPVTRNHPGRIKLED